MNKVDWSEYQKQTKDDPPSKLLVEALKYVSAKTKALDLGDGALKDARYLLMQGFEVTVVDKEIHPAIRETLDSKMLHVHNVAFDEFVFEKDTFDLATAMFALPFNPPKNFDHVFNALKDSLKKGGIFCGQFFGKQDGWSNNPHMTFHTKSEIEHLLADMETISLVEIEKDSKTANGDPKHWHVFHVIARK